MPPGSKAEGPPRLIGIAGPSCAGKTTLAQALLTQLPGPATALALDAYYRDFAGLSPEEKAGFNFDAPEALDREELVGDLRQLALGHAVSIPVYDFATHARQAATPCIEPSAFLIVEGLYALYWTDINALYQLKIFVAAPDALCLQRRLARDAADRGRSPASIRTQYLHQVRPMYQHHIHPTAHSADLLLDGGDPIEAQIDEILTYLR